VTRAFFDTNVVVYALHPSIDLRHEIAERLLSEHLVGGTMVLSTQVLQETYSVLTRKLRVEHSIALASVASVAREEVFPSTGEFVVRSLALVQRYQLSVWDALLVGAALESGCNVLYTEDLPSGMRFGDLVVVDPFSLSAHESTPGVALTAPAAPAPKPRAPRRAAPAAQAAAPGAGTPASRPAPRRPRK
jgi:predicted nucleic acid-binding protein